MYNLCAMDGIAKISNDNNLAETYRREPTYKRSLETFSPLLLGITISFTVCIPLLRPGYLLLLDWVIGPNAHIVSPSFYGLQGGVNTSFLSEIVTGILAHTIGSAATWLPIFLFFPLACISIARVTKKSLIAKLASGLFFSINPFVVERIYAGQIVLLYGYILLPILIVTVDNWVRRDVTTVTHVVLILTLMISIDVHYAWIGGLIVLVGMIVGIKDHAIRRSIPLLLILIVSLNIYLVIPVLGHPLPVNPTDNQTLLKAFSTRGDRHLGLFINVLGLYGFWRQMHESSKTLVSGWPFFLLGIILLSMYGLKVLWRRDEKKLALIIGTSLLVAYFLALGSQGPTGSFFNLLYRVLPGFSMMREPEKFSAILATGISILLGEGLASISLHQASRNATIAIIAIGGVLEIGYNPIIFWALHGQVQTSQLPSDWTKIANLVNRIHGNTLILPWHQYLSFPFTQKRIISNPGPEFLPGGVISGDNLQLGPISTTSTSIRSSYVNWLTKNEYNTDNFGKLLAPIGVEYIVILKTYSTGPMSWISQQKDLRVVYSSNDVELIKNMDFAGLAQIIPTSPIANLNTLLAEANSSHPANSESILNNLISNRVKLKSTSTSMSYKSGKLGWLNLDTSYFPGWRLNGNSSIPSTFGTLAFKIKYRTGNVDFQPWIYIVIGYLTSAVTFLGVFRRATVGRLKRRHTSKTYGSANIRNPR